MEKIIALDSNVIFLMAEMMYDYGNEEVYAELENGTFDKNKYMNMPESELPPIFASQISKDDEKFNTSKDINTAMVIAAHRLKKIFFNKKHQFKIIVLPSVLKEIDTTRISTRLFLKRHCKVIKFHDQEHEELFNNLSKNLVNEYLRCYCFEEKDIADAHIMAEASILGIGKLLTFNKNHFIRSTEDFAHDIRHDISVVNDYFYSLEHKNLEQGTADCLPITPQEFCFSFIRDSYSNCENSLIHKKPQFFSYTAYSKMIKLQTRIKQKAEKKNKTRDKVTLRKHYQELDIQAERKSNKLKHRRLRRKIEENRKYEI